MRAVRAVFLVGAVALAACGGGSDDAVETTAAPAASTATTEPSTDTTEATGDFDIAQVEQSVVKIAAEGTFIDPEVGEQRNSAGVGSGAIISEDGLVVTNNHVVTGAALLRVYLAGENDPVNAQVLGVSECSDLAVIRLEGSGYPALDYRDDDVTPGLDVYAGERREHHRRRRLHAHAWHRERHDRERRDVVGLGRRGPGTRCTHPRRQLGWTVGRRAGTDRRRQLRRHRPE